MAVLKRCPVSDCTRDHSPSDLFCPIHGAPLIVEAAPLLESGQTISSRYSIVRRIGAGGMGEVYLANQINPRQSVAIKILHPQFMSDHARRFQEEAERAAQVRHPHAVTIYETGKTAEGLLYIAMEYIPGIDLSSLIVQDGPRSEHYNPDSWQSRSTRIIEQICDVLRQAHGLNPPVIHRDLKPSNIRMWNSPASRDFVKLVDFGIAKQIGVTGFTRQGQIPGTPGYISPEQLQEQPVDVRSDLYSLGVVWYQMLTGELPFQGNGDYDTAMMRLRVRAPRAAAKNPAVSEDISETIAKLLERDPRDRYASADELGKAIAAARTKIDSRPTAESPTVVQVRKADAPTVVHGQVTAQQLAGILAIAQQRRWVVPAAAIVLFLFGMATAWMLAGENARSTADAGPQETDDGQRDVLTDSPMGTALAPTVTDSISNYWSNVYGLKYVEDSSRLVRVFQTDSGRWTERGREQIRDSLRRAAIAAMTPQQTEPKEPKASPARTGSEDLGSLAMGDTVVIQIHSNTVDHAAPTCDDPSGQQSLIRLTFKSSKSECRLYFIPDQTRGDSLRVYGWRTEDKQMMITDVFLSSLAERDVRTIKVWYDEATTRVFFGFDRHSPMVINSFHREKPVVMSGCSSLFPVGFQVERR
jgi:serine/threonine protein kinase